VDKASPKLSEFSITGKHASDVTLACSKPTGRRSPEELLTLKFKEGYLLNFRADGSSGEDAGTESVT
jgi:type VI protein secretion system component Hcp